MTKAMTDTVVEINPISAASLCIEMMYDDIRLAVGTAFYFKYNESRYLVSNWHNFSGRNPDTGKPLHKETALPNLVRVHCRNQEDLSILELRNFALSNEQESFWLQHPEHKAKVDIGVLPISPEDLTGDIDIVAAVNEVDPHQKWPIEVGEQLFVVGYPFGISDTYNLPIWKAASLASEPCVDQEQLPLLYVDTATREGMSGSPVIHYRRRFPTLIENERLYRFHAEFVGVYSGRIVPKDLLEAQLGKIWRAKTIEDIIEGNSYYSE